MCKCARCGALADGKLADGTLLCDACHAARVVASQLAAGVVAGCRRCKDQEPARLLATGHGLWFCAPCYAAYESLGWEQLAGRQPRALEQAHPELADVAAVYAGADWEDGDPWL